MGSERVISREIRKHTVPRHVRVGAVDKFLNLDFVDRRRLKKVDALDKKALQRKVANAVDAQQGLHKIVEERVRKNAKGKGRLLAEDSYRTLRWETL